MVKAIVSGAAGRMGARIISMIHGSEGIILAGAFEHPENRYVGQDAGQLAGLGEIGIRIAGSIDEVIGLGEVVIDFSTPGATLENLKKAASHGLSMVIGTTGITGEELKQIEKLAGKIRCVMSPNMSVGMNVMFRIVEEMAGILGNDYDIEILEAHHRLKKDAPSGTAMRLAQILANATNRDLSKVAVYARRGVTGERGDKEIGIQALRAGDITGDHTVMFGGTGERLELIHRAHNRDNFARGALKAAKWIVNQPVGLYDMQDVLGIK
jgi:4-hydroxy-tetrahydrodipicolinate reductase